MSAQRSFREFVSQRFSKLQTELLDEHEAKLQQLLVENTRLNTVLGEQPVDSTAAALNTAGTCAEEVSDPQARPVDSNSPLQPTSTKSSPTSADSAKGDVEDQARVSTKPERSSTASSIVHLGLPQTIHEEEQISEDLDLKTGYQKSSSLLSQESLRTTPRQSAALASNGSCELSPMASNNSSPSKCHSNDSVAKTASATATKGKMKMSKLRFSFQPASLTTLNKKTSVISCNTDSNSPHTSRVYKSALSGKQRDISMPSDCCEVPEGEDGMASDSSNDDCKASEYCEYRLHAAWRQYVKEDNQVLRRTLSRQHTNVMDIYKEAEAEEDPAGHQLEKNCFTRRVAVLPTSTRRLLWDLISFVFVCYDAVVIPLQFFNPPETNATANLAHCARVFWTIDIIWSFITIQMSVDGDIEVDFFKIAYQYMTTWFLFDIFIVVVDWVDLVSSVGEQSGSNSSSAIRSMRVFRAIRLLRLMRLVRNSPEISRLLATYIRSEKTKVVFGVGQITVIVIGIAHVIACCWYGVSINTDGDSWVKMQDLENASLQARYVSSFYWSMVQFTGSGIMAPQNNSERVFGCFVLMIAFMISVSIVSSLTTLMTRLQLITAQTTRQLSVLHRYLIDHKISSKLASRVQRNASHALAELRKNTPESGVELLELVSKPLRVELRFEVNGPVLMQHPFFSCYSITNPGGIRQVCFLAVTELTLSAGDIVFNTKEKVDQLGMFFVLTGKLKYSLHESRFEDEQRILEPGNWICEAVLWVDDWPLQGSLRAKSECKLLCLRADSFQVTSAAFRTSEFFPAQYGIGFLQELNLVSKEQLTDIAEDIIHINGIVRSVFPEHVGARLKSGRRRSSGFNFFSKDLWSPGDKSGSSSPKKGNRKSGKVRDLDSDDWGLRGTSGTASTETFASVVFNSENPMGSAGSEAGVDVTD